MQIKATKKKHGRQLWPTIYTIKETLNRKPWSRQQIFFSFFHFNDSFYLILINSLDLYTGTENILCKVWKGNSVCWENKCKRCSNLWAHTSKGCDLFMGDLKKFNLCPKKKKNRNENFFQLLSIFLLKTLLRIFKYQNDKLIKLRESSNFLPCKI